MDLRRILSIVLASPSDVESERQILDGVVKEINAMLRDLGFPIDLELRRWETDAYPGLQVGRGAARGRAGRGWFGVGAGRRQGLGVHSQPPSLRTDGYNIFLYHHPTQPGAPILCDFGVEVTRAFETAGEVYATETQAGEAAVAVHRGPYNRMNEAHDAIRKWMAANRKESAGHSWEIYGDPTPDPADTETTVV
jgi:hypothetical protein